MIFTDKKIVLTSNAISAEVMRDDILKALEENFVPSSGMDPNCRSQLAMIRDMIKDIKIDKHRSSPEEQQTTSGAVAEDRFNKKTKEQYSAWDGKGVDPRDTRGMK